MTDASFLAHALIALYAAIVVAAVFCIVVASIGYGVGCLIAYYRGDDWNP